MQNVLFVHETNASDNLRIEIQNLGSQVLVHFEIHQQVLKSPPFAELHHHEQTIATHAIIDVFYYVWMSEDLQSIDLFYVLLIAYGLLYGHCLQKLLLLGLDNSIAAPNRPELATAERFLSIEDVIAVSLVRAAHYYYWNIMIK